MKSYEEYRDELRGYKKSQKGKQQTFKKVGKNGTRYIDTFMTFDIETTTITTDDNTKATGKVVKFAYMYIWQACIGKASDTKNFLYVEGRTWEEFTDFICAVQDVYKLSSEKLMCIYVHNLAYEYSFLKSVMDFEKCFFTEARKPLFLQSIGFEFRCSYRLSNKSLLQLTKGCEHEKAMGDLVYTKVRHSTTPITEGERNYVENDVIGLFEAVSKMMVSDNDNLATIPYTSTGYVRRDVVKAIKKGCKDEVTSIIPDLETVLLLKEAQRGGDTHANKYMCGDFISNVMSFDMVSAYPAVLLQEKFPMTSFRPFTNGEDLPTILKTKAWVAHVTFSNIVYKDSQNCNPYISVSKCLHLSKGYDNDNGRVFSADSLTVAITDIDYQIIRKRYDFDDVEIHIDTLKTAVYDWLPRPIRQCIMDYWKIKTDIKRSIKIETDPDKLLDLEYEYGKSKAKLNSIYGMMATDPMKKELICIYDEESGTETYTESEEKSDEEIAEKAKLPLQWGVWTTCYCRQRLHEGIDCCRHFIYCDTDSVKGTDFDMKKLDLFNQKIIEKSNLSGAYLEYDGKREYLGIYEEDAHYSTFTTLGAKKYCYEKDGKLGVTVSGVSKEEGKRQLKSIYDFKVGTKFVPSGGMNVTYSDDRKEKHFTVIDYRGAKEDVTVYSFAGMTERVYELGITDKQALDYMLDPITGDRISYESTEAYM